MVRWRVRKCSCIFGWKSWQTYQSGWNLTSLRVCSPDISPNCFAEILTNRFADYIEIISLSTKMSFLLIMDILTQEMNNVQSVWNFKGGFMEAECNLPSRSEVVTRTPLINVPRCLATMGGQVFVVNSSLCIQIDFEVFASVFVLLWVEIHCPAVPGQAFLASVRVC